MAALFVGAARQPTLHLAGGGTGLAGKGPAESSTICQEGSLLPLAKWLTYGVFGLAEGLAAFCLIYL